MKIYIASPYTKGDVAINVHRAFAVADKLVERGHIPYIPHWTHFWHILSPKTWDFWMSYDESFIRDWCDSILRLDGESVGANREVDLALSLNKSVFYSLEEIPYENC